MLVIEKFPFKIKPFSHQLREFNQYKDHEYRALFWEMGTGKTKAALDKGAHLYEQNKITAIMIVAPNGVHIDHITIAVPEHLPSNTDYKSAYWKATLSKKEKLALKIIERKTDKLKIIAFNTDSLRINGRAYNYFKNFLKENKSLVVIDESSDFKNPKSQRTKGLLSIKHLCEYRMIMDGTPITQGPSDIYSPFDFLQSGLLGYTSFTAFQARYEVMINPQILRQLEIIIGSSVEEKFYSKGIYNLRLTGKYPKVTDLKRILPDRYHHKIRNVLSAVNRNPLFRTGHRNVEELYDKLKPYSTRYKKSECLDLPDKLSESLTYDLPKEQSKLYNELVNDLRMRVSEESEMTVSNVLVLYTRLQQIIGGFYVDDDTEKIISMPGENSRLKVLLGSIERLSYDTKIIIWCRFVKEIELITTELEKIYSKESVVTYYGATKSDDRQIAKDRFAKDPECRFFVGNQDSAGRGLNLVSASYMYFFSKTLSLGRYLQAIDRFHRPGQLKNCTVISIIANRTIDEKIIEAYDKKQSIADFITGDYLRLLK